VAPSPCFSTCTERDNRSWLHLQKDGGCHLERVQAKGKSIFLSTAAKNQIKNLNDRHVGRQVVGVGLREPDRPSCKSRQRTKSLLRAAELVNCYD
jgi:hypothetical protein